MTDRTELRRLRPLHTHVALRDDYTTPGCWAWMDGPGKRCSKPEGKHPHLCDRHAKVAQRRRDKYVAREQAAQERRDARDRARLVPKLPELRERLASLDREIARRTTAPTDDMAAYGGVEVGAVSRWQARQLSDSNIQRMVELLGTQKLLREQIARAEELEGSC